MGNLPPRNAQNGPKKTKAQGKRTTKEGLAQKVDKRLSFGRPKRTICTKLGLKVGKRKGKCDKRGVGKARVTNPRAKAKANG